MKLFVNITWLTPVEFGIVVTVNLTMDRAKSGALIHNAAADNGEMTCVINYTFLR